MKFHSLLKVCRTSLSQNRLGALELEYRLLIWQSFGAVSYRQGQLLYGVGWRCRTQLDRLCVEYVLPHWRRVFPQSDEPEQLLMLTDRFAQKKVDQATLKLAREKARTQVLHLMNTFQNQSAFGVLLAACRMTTTYLSDEIILTSRLHSIETLKEDFQIDVQELDTAWHASMVYSGMEYDPTTSKVIRRRREFWKWYLQKAVPTVLKNESIEGL